MKQTERAWIQKDGTKVLISKMTVQHLKNTIAMLKRNGRHKPKRVFRSVENLFSEPDWMAFSPDSMASYFHDQFIDEAIQDGGYWQTIPPSKAYPLLVKELNRRTKKRKKK